MPLNTKIQEVIESMTPSTLYLRAAHLEEANLEVAHIDINTQVLAIHADTPDITYTVNESKYTSALFPVSVYFVMKAEQDQTGPQIDTILDTCIESANQFFDLMTNDAIALVPEYVLETFIATQISDDFLTGVRILFDYPEDREVYYCLPIYASDFSDGVDGWISSGKGGLQAINGALRTTLQAGGIAASWQIVKTPVGKAGDTVTVYFDIRVPSSNSVATGGFLDYGSQAISIDANNITQDEWVSFNGGPGLLNFDPAQIRILITDTNDVNITEDTVAAVGDYIEIRNVKVYKE